MDMRRRWLPLVLPAAALLAFTNVGRAQQQPIFGCRHAISCRNSPVGLSALNDPGASGLLLYAGIRWGPGFHFGLALPFLKLPEPEAAVDIHAFHLRNVTLLPTPEPAPPPAPPTPPPTSDRSGELSSPR